MGIKNINKLMSLVLRHKPEVLNIKIDNKGWTDFNILIEKIQIKHPEITREDILYIIEHNDKKRFDLLDDHTKIRANQGHSINVSIDLEKVNVGTKGITLYHGTPQENLTNIMASGLKKMNRTHVHLSGDIETAEIVGKRYNKPYYILKVTIPNGTEDLYISKNGVYLMDNVPPENIELFK